VAINHHSSEHQLFRHHLYTTEIMSRKVRKPFTFSNDFKHGLEWLFPRIYAPGTMTTAYTRMLTIYMASDSSLSWSVWRKKRRQMAMGQCSPLRAPALHLDMENMLGVLYCVAV
jgi:hypothetical protein